MHFYYDADYYYYRLVEVVVVPLLMSMSHFVIQLNTFILQYIKLRFCLVTHQMMSFISRTIN